MTKDYVACANRYVKGVLDGTILANRYVRLACERYRDDLEKQQDDSYPFEFNEDYAAQACRFIEALPHTKGVWASRGELLVLQDWQCFIVVNLFGWVEKRSGLRRFREFYGEIPRKNAKSTLAAAIGLLMLTWDNEHGAEVYSGATTEEQAWEVFRPAKIMAEKTPDLREYYGLEVAAKSLFISANGSRFKPVIGKPGDGPSPHCAIVDEYHEHKTDDLYDTMKTGMGARQHPMTFVITTAGTDVAGPCFALRSDAIKVLEGTIQNDRWFIVVWGIDEDDDWTSEEALIKANPNFNVSVSGEYLRQQQLDAINSARKQNTFKTKHLNVWCHARSPWMNLESWMRAADPSLSIEDFEGETCVAGIDVAAKQDITSYCRVFSKNIDGIEHYYVFSRHWLPEETAENPDKKHYLGWVAEGYLQTTPGSMIDADYIEADVQADNERNRIRELGFDSWGAYQLASNLQEGKTGRKIKVVDIPMNTKNLSEPMKLIAALADAGRIHHNGDPVLTWCVSNVTVKPDANDNIFPRKERDESKIDAAVAMIIAFNREFFGEKKKDSVYSRRGIRTL